MKLFLSIMATLLLAALTVPAQEDSFLNAQTAYDEGRYAEAALLYEKLINTGTSNPEVHYNLANAYFKDSDLPLAVWHYRKAWYEMPRDPDINANLHFAMNATGAIEPAPKMIERFFSMLSYQEWIWTATAGYVFLSVLLLLLLFARRSRRPVLKLCLVPLLMILLAVLGGWRWQQLESSPEWVVVKTEATALFGPVAGSTAHFKVPIGALVRQRSIDPKGWIEVEYDGKQGWLKTDFISKISP